MTPAPRACWLAAHGRRLFSVLHLPAAASGGGVLVCPPLFHEHARSYRLFALLADALADCGLTVLRFDYYGTGDSAGEDAEFTLAGAHADAACALAALRERVGKAPVAVLGIRGGAIPAAHCAVHAGSDALWLWQPPASGAECLADLQRRDAHLRALHGYAAGVAGDRALLGFACNPSLPDELRAARMPAALDAGDLPMLVLDAAGHPGPFARAQRVDLAAPLHAWIDQIAMRRVPRAPLQQLGVQLAAQLHAGSAATSRRLASAEPAPGWGSVSHG